MSVTSCPSRISVRARFDPTFPPPAMRTYIRLAQSPFAGAHCLGQGLDRARGRADDVEAARGVELGARMVEDADDDRGDGELLLRHLADDDVRVVAVGRDDNGVGIFDAGIPQELEIHS